MHTSYISLSDSVYEMCRIALTNGQRSVMIYDDDHNIMKIEVINGCISSMLDGVMLPVINSTTKRIMSEAKPEKDHIEICKQSMEVSKKKAHAYLDKLTTLAYEKGFPLNCVEFSDIPGVIESHVPGVTLEIFNELINDTREMIDNGKFLTPHEEYKETLEIKLKSLFDGYRMVVKNKSTFDADVFCAHCYYLRLELDFFLKYKNFIDAEKHYRSVAKNIREEFPLAMFNVKLMDYFDACMAHSEGSVKDATIYTRAKYDDITVLHSNL